MNPPADLLGLVVIVFLNSSKAGGVSRSCCRSVWTSFALGTLVICSQIRFVR